MNGREGKKMNAQPASLMKRKSNRLVISNKTDTSIRIMNKPKRSACSRDVTNINNVFFLLCTMVER